MESSFDRTSRENYMHRPYRSSAQKEAPQRRRRYIVRRRARLLTRAICGHWAAQPSRSACRRRLPNTRLITILFLNPAGTTLLYTRSSVIYTALALWFLLNIFYACSPGLLGGCLFCFRVICEFICRWCEHWRMLSNGLRGRDCLGR